MSGKIFIVIVAVLAAGLFGAQVAHSGPMKCSSQEQACMAACKKGPTGLIPNCVTNCRARFNFCRQTGCWDDGKSRYCRLLRQ